MNWCVYPGHFWLQRPISAVFNNRVDETYRYGSTQSGTREAHHGVEMNNPIGTPVLSSADGVVLVAGDDQKIVYGPYLDFYGNLIIIQHDFPQYNQKLYTVYGHLSMINVQQGQLVKVGQKIGEVGVGGAAIGSHLHFEVRSGQNSYDHTSNPELWLQPLINEQRKPINGVIAIRLTSEKGTVYGVSITIEPLSPEIIDPNKPQMYAETYAFATPAQDLWNENLVVGDLLPGEYRIIFERSGKIYRNNTVIRPGELTLLTIKVDS
jgi:murein DD-endopeptidase MepM/ murein hydrolase activator NlpD